MAKCDYPQKVLDKGTRSKTGKVYNDDVVVSCGKCYNCRMRRIRSWIFRLKKEYEVSVTAHFITLTYDNQHVPITSNGFMTLHESTQKSPGTKYQSSHAQKFFKKLRKLENRKLTYYLIGEYGGVTQRPHYHAIIFNVSNQENIDKAWIYGSVHIGTVTEASIAYTLEYISKQSIVKKHGRDNRVLEYSLFSKGIGKSYLTEEIKQFHKQNKLDMYITIEDGTKIALPKYYRDKIFDDKEKAEQALHVQKVVSELNEQEYQEKGFRKLESEKRARVNKLNSKKQKSKDL